jgi:predicted membrane protein
VTFGPQTTSPPSGFRITPQLVFGVVIICVGVIFSLDQLGYSPALSYLRFWPMALVAVGVAKMLTARDGGGACAGLVFTVVGVWLQGEELGLIHARLIDIWPVALVLFGGFLVWSGLTRRAVPPVQPPAPTYDPPLVGDSVGSTPRSWGPSAPLPPPDPLKNPSPRITDTNSTMSAMAILGGVSRGNNSRAFRGADLLAVMGGCVIDLRQAAINGEAVIDVFAMWGGIEIKVPEDWTVVSRVVPLMGGVDDKTRPPQTATAHRLVLRGFAVMGGIEIKN